MGMFSWLTADTNRSIPAAGSCRPTFPVFLLSPTGEKYKETEYEGYGVFGGVDAYDLCARVNADHLGMNEWYKAASIDERRCFGIFLSIGSVYADSNGRKWTVCTPKYPVLASKGIEIAAGNYGEPAAEGLLSPNELISSGEWKKLSTEALGLLKYPIKIVESSEMDYATVGVSSDCPNQGFFYDDDDEHDLEDESWD
jgi:hypothetical protein